MPRKKKQKRMAPAIDRERQDPKVKRLWVDSLTQEALEIEATQEVTQGATQEATVETAAGATADISAHPKADTAAQPVSQ